MSPAFAPLVLALLVLPGLAGAQVYEWVDENGKRQFSDQPPPGIISQEKHYEITNIDSNMPAPVAPDLERSRREAMEDEAKAKFLADACRQAEEDLVKLNGRVNFTENGKTLNVSERERARIAESLEATIRRYCG